MRNPIFIEETKSIAIPGGAIIAMDGNSYFRATADDLGEVSLASIAECLQAAIKLSTDGGGKKTTPGMFIEYEPHDVSMLSDWELERLQGGDTLFHEERLSAIFMYLEDADHLCLSLSVDFPYTNKKEEALRRVGRYIHYSLGEITETRFCEGMADAPAWEFIVAPRPGLMMAQCVASAQCIESLLRYRNMDAKTPEGVIALLLAGHTSFLIGLPESDWLEVKQSYGISNKSQRHEFACDVAAFANSKKAGLIIIGVGSERDSRGRDVINQLTPCRSGSINLQTYQQAVSDRVIPAIDGLSFDVVDVEGGDLLLVRIPDQDHSKTPFIVKGGVTDPDASRISMASFSIPVRRNADKEFMNPEWVHLLLASGRAFLSHRGAE